VSSNNKIIKRAVRSFVRREGRWTDGQRKAYADFAKLYAFDPSLSWQDAFANNNTHNILEIGFGMGGSLVQMAAADQASNFLGVEVHRPGVSALYAGLDAHKLANVRAYADDVVPLLKEKLPAASVDKVQIFFPDPWPKRCHHKRRLIQIDFLNILKRCLAHNAVIHVATDWQDYADLAVKVFEQHPDFIAASDDVQNSCLASRPKTKFEERGLNLGHDITDLVYVYVGR
jgi:tRNA (guanine-N7-)-methyltransferase